MSSDPEPQGSRTGSSRIDDPTPGAPDLAEQSASAPVEPVPSAGQSDSRKSASSRTGMAWRTAESPENGPVRRPSMPFSRVLSMALIFTVPLAIILAVLVIMGYLPALPAMAGVVVGVVMMILLLRPLAGDWAAVAAYLRPEPGRAEKSGPPPELRFSEAAREVAVAARSLRLRTAQALTRAENEVKAGEALLDALPNAMLLMNGDSVITRVNDAARTLFGRELDGSPLTSVMRDPGVLDAVDQVLSGGVHGRRMLQVTLGATVERSFEVEVQQIHHEAFEARVLVILHDITTLVRAEQMRADFVANASHELRTPLTSVLGFIETLRGPARDDTEAQERFLGIMYQQASRMKRLIEDLLSLSRIELREHTPPTAGVDLKRVLDSVVMGLEILADDKDITLECELDALQTVKGDPDELGQVFQNLVSNGIKYGRPGTSVTIRAERPNRGPAQMPYSTRNACLAIHVIDRGDGIAKEHLPRLTERFYRVDTARSRQMGGTGLGLAIVKHIVNRHRGALVVDSTVGRGSTFTVYLPLKND